MSNRQPQQETCHTAVTSALIAVGSNVPRGENSPISTVCEAISGLVDADDPVAAISRLYRTPAFPPGSGEDFINAAVAIGWPGEPGDLLDRLHAIERAFGRTRRTRWEPRVLDLDLIALGRRVWPDSATQSAWRDLPPARAAREAPEGLILPHPRLAERGFVLVPLADIAPDWTHPLTGLCVRQMLAALDPAATAGIVPVEPPRGALPFAPSVYR